MISALKDLKEERNKNRKIEKQLEEAKELMCQLTAIIKETQKITDDMSHNIAFKSDECSRHEETIVLLRAEVEKLKKSSIT